MACTENLKQTSHEACVWHWHMYLKIRCRLFKVIHFCNVPLATYYDQIQNKPIGKYLGTISYCLTAVT